MTTVCYLDMTSSGLMPDAPTAMSMANSRMMLAVRSMNVRRRRFMILFHALIIVEAFDAVGRSFAENFY